MDHDVGEDGDELREIVLVHARAEGRHLLVHADVQLGGEREERLQQLLRAQGLGAALAHHPRREPGEPRLALRIVQGAGAEAELDVDDRILIRGQLDQLDPRRHRAGGHARRRRDRRRLPARGPAVGRSRDDDGRLVRFASGADRRGVGGAPRRRLCSTVRLVFPCAAYPLLPAAGDGHRGRQCACHEPGHRPPPLAVASVTVVRFRSMKCALANSCRSRGCTCASAANSLLR